MFFCCKGLKQIFQQALRKTISGKPNGLMTIPTKAKRVLFKNSVLRSFVGFKGNLSLICLSILWFSFVGCKGNLSLLDIWFHFCRELVFLCGFRSNPISAETKWFDDPHQGSLFKNSVLLFLFGIDFARYMFSFCPGHSMEDFR